MAATQDNESLQGIDLVQMSSVIEELLELARTDIDGRTPLHLVHDYNWFPFSNAQVAAELISRGAVVDAFDRCGATPMSDIATR